MLKKLSLKVQVLYLITLFLPFSSLMSQAQMEHIIRPIADSTDQEIIWAVEPGKHYRVDSSLTLQGGSWTEGAVFKADNVYHRVPMAQGALPKQFFRMARVDREAPVIVDRYPDDGSIAVGRFADFSIRLEDEHAIDPASISLKIGSAAPLTVGSGLTLVDKVVTYDAVDNSHGGYKEDIDVVFTVADVLANQATYTWTFETEVETQINVNNLLVFGSPTAQRAGHRLSARQRNLARAMNLEVVRIPANNQNAGWVYSTITANTLVIEATSDITGDGTFSVGQYLANDCPETREEIFYRKVTAITPFQQVQAGGPWVATLSTEDVALAEIVNGSLKVPTNPTYLKYDTNNKFIPDDTNGFGYQPSGYDFNGIIDFPGIDADWSGINYTLNSQEENLPAGKEASVTFGSDPDNFRFRFKPKVMIEANFDNTLAFDIQDPRPSELKITFDGEISAAVVPKLVFSGNYSGLFEKEIMPPRKHAVRFFIGVVPCWCDVEFSVIVRGDLDTDLDAEFSAGFTYDRHFSYSVNYDASSKHYTFNKQTPTSSVTGANAGLVQKGPALSASGDLDAKLALIPRIELKLYSLAGFYSEISPYVKTETSINSTVAVAEDLEAVLSVKAQAGVEFEMGLETASSKLNDKIGALLGPVDLFSPFTWTYELSSHELLAQVEQAWVIQPNTQTVNKGGSVNFIARSNSPHHTYQWYKDNAPIPGATAMNFSIFSADDSHAGYYFCVVGDGYASYTSRVAKLRVVEESVNVEVDLYEKRIAAIYYRSYFIKDYNSMWAMGDNHYGELGDGTTTDRSTPVQVASDVKNVVGGLNHTLFVKNDGSLWAMGRNSFGQLGDGSSASRSMPIHVANGVQSAVAGTNHTLFIKDNGTLWGMGYNGFGLLGVDTEANQITPVQVANEVREVCVGRGGNKHTFFIKNDGSLWGMGFNSYGQLGDGSATRRKIPILIANGVKSVKLGLNNTFFIKNDGSLWAMGDNESGKLGDGTTMDRATPVNVASGVKSVSVGRVHTLFVKHDGSLWAMGNNTKGQLGDGTTVNRSSPVQVATGVSSVRVGRFHTFFIKSDGSLWSMGKNSSGQLGDGTTTNRSLPFKVKDAVKECVTGGSFGGSHALFLEHNGSLWAMGKNYPGQLGDGTTTSRSTPIKVTDGL